MIEKGLGLRTSGVGRPAARRAQVGTVDATMLTPPVNFFAEGAGFRNVGMILDYAKDLPFSAMDVSLAYAGKHRDMLAKLLVVIDKSIAWFNDDSHRDEAINILAKEMKVEAARSYDYFRKIDYFAPDYEVSRARLQNLVNEIKTLGDIRHRFRTDRDARPYPPRRVVFLCHEILHHGGITIGLMSARVLSDHVFPAGFAERPNHAVSPIASFCHDSLWVKSQN
jgi:hypothetical protein